MKLQSAIRCLSLALLTFASGCSLFPAAKYRDRIHNPFPQLKRVAVLPFFNQSSDPTVDGDLVAQKYYAALQAIPGFEVLPVGVVKSQWLRFAMAHGEPQTGEQFQQLARQMGVEAIVVGSVTDFDAYYPPRMGMTVHWYAANEGFHPIPAGYGLPWGTEFEKQIPRRIAREAEFELARHQLMTQSPVPPTPLDTPVFEPKIDDQEIESSESDALREESPTLAYRQTSGQIILNPPEGSSGAYSNMANDPFGDQGQHVTDPGIIDPPGERISATHSATDGLSMGDRGVGISQNGPGTWSDPHGDIHDPLVQQNWDVAVIDPPLPPNWPTATDFIPDPPSVVPPIATPNHEPILSHTRLYRGDDPYFTNRLADHVETGDDARPGSWQGYLKRSDDFIHFCCHLHITEMLESRGGRDQSDLILRWPLSRY